MNLRHWRLTKWGRCCPLRRAPLQPACTRACAGPPATLWLWLWLWPWLWLWLWLWPWLWQLVLELELELLLLHLKLLHLELGLSRTRRCHSLSKQLCSLP